MTAKQEAISRQEIHSPNVLEAAENELYRSALTHITETAQQIGVDIRFVGGTFTDLLTEETTVLTDWENRTIYLKDHKPLQLRRKDNTIKDIDLITLCPRQEDCEQFRTKIQKNTLPYPSISVEPTFYAGWEDRKIWKQMVSTIDCNWYGTYSFNFGPVHQPVSEASLEGWTVILEDGTHLRILHPFAHALRYFMRVPSGAKPKDKQGKIGRVFRIGNQVLLQSLEQGQNRQDFIDAYDPWIAFIDTICTTRDPRVSIKSAVTGFWWQTLGEAASHGRGIFKEITKLADKFTG